MPSEHRLKWASALTMLALMAAALAACSKRPQYQPLPPGTVVLAFGDSITHGTGVAAGEDYPSKLAAKTGWQLVNGGVPSDTTETARDRLRPLLDEYSPKLVIVELGGNDFLRGVADAPVTANLEAMLAEIKAAGAIAVLVEVPRPSLAAMVGMGGGAPLYGQLAERQKVLLVEKVLPQILAESALKTDAVHPNAEGYAKLADGLAEAFTAAGLLP